MAKTSSVAHESPQEEHLCPNLQLEKPHPGPIAFVSERPDQRLRVMFLDHVASLSGAEVAMFNLIRHFDLSVLRPIVVLGEEGALADRLRSFAEVHILPMHSDVRDARKDELDAGSVVSFAVIRETVRYVRALIRFIRNNRIDILHANSLKSDVLGGVAARLSGRLLIWHVRDRIAPDYLPARVASGFRWISRWLPHLIIADSQAVAATLSHAPSPRIRVVHEGTPLAEFADHQAPPVPGDAPGRQIVGLVGRISFWKGQDVFLRAAARLCEKYPFAQFRIIGAALFSEVEYEKSLHTMALTLGLKNAVVFSGFRHDIHQAIGELDVLVHASTRPEPFGQVIIEGMAAGKPVVATNAGGVREIITEGDTGLLVPMGDPESMADAIDRLLADPQSAREMGRRGQAHVAENFGIEKTVAGVMSCYRQLTQRAL